MRPGRPTLVAVVVAALVSAQLAACEPPIVNGVATCNPACADGDACRVDLEARCGADPSACTCPSAPSCTAPPGLGAICSFRDENPDNCATGFDIQCAPGLACVAFDSGDPACPTPGGAPGFASCCLSSST